MPYPTEVQGSQAVTRMVHVEAISWLLDLMRLHESTVLICILVTPEVLAIDSDVCVSALRHDIIVTL